MAGGGTILFSILLGGFIWASLLFSVGDVGACSDCDSRFVNAAGDNGENLTDLPTTLDNAFDKGKIIDGASSPANALVIGNGNEYWSHEASDMGYGFGTSNNIVSNTLYSIMGLGSPQQGSGILVFAGNNLTKKHGASLNLFAWNDSAYPLFTSGFFQLQLQMSPQPPFGANPKTKIRTLGGQEFWMQSDNRMRFYLDDNTDWFQWTGSGGAYMHFYPALTNPRLVFDRHVHFEANNQGFNFTDEDIETTGDYYNNGNQGLTTTIWVMNGTGSGNCSLSVDGGIITGTTCEET